MCSCLLIIYNSLFGNLELHYHCCRPPSYTEHLACRVPRCRSCPVCLNDMQSSTLIIHVWVYKWRCYAEKNQSSRGNAVGRKWKFNSCPRLVLLISKQAHYFASTDVFFFFIVTRSERSLWRRTSPVMYLARIDLDGAAGLHQCPLSRHASGIKHSMRLWMLHVRVCLVCCSSKEGKRQWLVAEKYSKQISTLTVFVGQNSIDLTFSPSLPLVTVANLLVLHISCINISASLSRAAFTN